MHTLLLRNARILDPGTGISQGDVLVQDGVIIAAGLVDWPGAVDEIAEANGRLVTPGLIDVHTHGVMKFLYEDGGDSMCQAAASLGRFGVTTVVPTLVPPSLSGAAKTQWLKRLTELVDAIPSNRGAFIPGLHLEGPFLAIAGAACATMNGDLQLLEEILTASRGRISVMSVSPETPDIIPVIRRLRDLGITVFITHTRASVEHTVEALNAGATHATHFYDVFYAPPETEPGVRPTGSVEAILADRRATVDFIADGIHVHPMAVRAAIAAKSWSGVTLITDSNIGAGLPAGTYDTPYGFKVEVSPTGAARNASNLTLAGSSLTMNRGMANLLQWLDLPPCLVWAMGTLNPARVLGLANKGRLIPGADADLVLWESDLEPATTWSRGVCIYEKSD